MKLSTKGRYGTRAMVDLAFHQDRGPVSLGDMSRRQGVSRRYLEHLVARLGATGLVRSTRGRGGGFVLARPASEISLADIIEALEGRISVVDCGADPSVCARSAVCAARDVWTDVSEIIMRHLSQISLEDLCQRQREKQGAGTSMYYI
jgi:Rrf2 family protein